jgi:alkylation response protein AidB-like acyl-CoA dehydrogenase
MDFDLTPEQKEIRALARDFARSEVAPVIRHFDEAHEFPHEILAKLGKTGLLGALVPEAYGGAQLDYVSYALAVEELNRVDASVGITMWAHNSLCTNHIALFGSPEQKAAYLPRLARGDILGAWGLTEPGSAPTTAMKSRAVPRATISCSTAARRSSRARRSATPWSWR